jgi:hypothetical protein
MRIDRPETDTAPSLPFGFAVLLLASFLFSTAITFNRGGYSEGALTLVLGGLGILVFCSLESGRPGVIVERNPRLQLGIVWLGLLAMTFQAINDEILIYPFRPWSLGRKMQLVLLGLLLSYLPFLTARWREPRFVRVARFAAFALAVGVAGTDAIRASPAPRIDVWTVQQAGAAELKAGHNPYRTVSMRDTGPRVGDDVPYVYPPVQLYVTLPAYAALGDVRYAMLAAMVLAGFAMRYITGRARAELPSIAEDAPALYLWLMPKLFFILEQAWVDPVQLMLIAFGFAAHVGKRPYLTAVLFGFVLASKQTMFWAVGLTGVLLGFDRRQWVLTAGVAAALVLPFVYLDFRALKHANFDFLTQLPSRPDALTFNSWYLRTFGSEMSKNVGFALAGLMALFAMWRMRGSAARLGLAVAATYAFFFTFNKWAFANYYFLISSLTTLAAATACHSVGVGLRLSGYATSPWADPRGASQRKTDHVGASGLS